MSALGHRSEAVQQLRHLVGRADARRDARSFVVEGAKLTMESLGGAAGAKPLSVFVDAGSAGEAERAVAKECAARGAKVLEVQPGVLARVLDPVTPQPLAAIVGFVDVPLAEALGATGDGAVLQLVLVLAGVRDPGNAGTLLRCASAAGARAVVFCSGAVDPYNPKTVRSSAGALFQVPVVAGVPADEALEALGRAGLCRWGTSARGGDVYTDVDLTAPAAVVLGNESGGIPGELHHHLDGVLTIPIDQRAESLNVAMAGSVICFEAARQRRSVLAGDAA